MKRFIVLAAALAVLALGVTPGTASPTTSSAVCTGWETAGAGVFDSTASLTATSRTARGGDVVREPNLNADVRGTTRERQG
jgi:hypothetical protein